MTLDIKFDINQPESIVKEDALDRYQENAYLLGKIFSVSIIFIFIIYSRTLKMENRLKKSVQMMKALL
jgi:hypothetical protein